MQKLIVQKDGDTGSFTQMAGRAKSTAPDLYHNKEAYEIVRKGIFIRNTVTCVFLFLHTS